MVAWKVVSKDNYLAAGTVGMTVVWTVDTSVDLREIAMVDWRVAKKVLWKAYY